MFNGIKDIQVGKQDEIIVLIKSISTNKMKSGEPYQKVIVRDRDGREATFIQFDALIGIKPPAIVKARVEAVKYGANVSIKIRKCEKTDISENREKFLTLPLNPSGAFARQGGILEATVKLMAVASAGQHGLDRDLLMAAAALYYSGHFDTVDAGYNNTVTYLMYGPAALACHKARMKSMALAASDAGAKDGIPEDDAMTLGHILMARGGTPSPRRSRKRRR